MHQRYTQYDRFAKIYNRHLSQFSQRALPVLERLMLSQLTAPAHILDICCGTGQMARALLARGYKVTGVDGSAQMLHLAKENAPGAQFFLSDVRDMNLSPSFAGAVSLFDSLNHILTLDELTLVFVNVRAALHPSGPFVFDLNMEQAFVTCWHRYFQAIEGNDHVQIQSSWDCESKLGRNHVTLLRADDGRPIEELTVVERCYSETEITTALYAAGFCSVRVYDAKRDLGMLEETGRSFFLCHNACHENG